MTKPKHTHWPLTELERFNKNVDRSGDCHIWTGSTNTIGYGAFSKTGGKKISAHRWVWEHTYGPIPAGKMVLHHCDNPSCVNPLHLYIGTALNNMRDKMNRGRHISSPGEKNGNSKLTENQVIEIRRLFDSGECRNQRELSRRFKTSYKNIHKIVHRQRWKHL